MEIEQIILFAKENKFSSSDLLAAFAVLEKEELKKILKTVSGKYFFGEEDEIISYDEYEKGCHFSEDCPILASKCFDENEDIAITKVFLNEQDEIVIGGFSIQNGPKDDYWFSPDDFCKGQISKITDEIRTYK